MKEKPAGAAAEEGKSCRWGGTVLRKKTNKQYRNRVVSKWCRLFSQLKKVKTMTMSFVVEKNKAET